MRSSPLAAGPKAGPTVQVFPATGSRPAATGTRKVGFFNHTDKDLDLVIEGKAVRLPRKTYLQAEVPPAFTWKHGANAAESATVPAGAAGSTWCSGSSGGPTRQDVMVPRRSPV